MSTSQFDLVFNQVKALPPHEWVTLIKKVVELIEQRQPVAEQSIPDYTAFFGAGKGVFASAEEVDRFIREERDAWER